MCMISHRISDTKKDLHPCVCFMYVDMFCWKMVREDDVKCVCDYVRHENAILYIFMYMKST